MASAFPHGRATARLLTFLVALLVAAPATAQVEPDTARAGTPDSVAAAPGTPGAPSDSPTTPADSLRRPAPPLSTPYEQEPGRAAGRVPLVETRFADLTELLAETPGAFTYDLGPPGLPDAWSFEGLFPTYAQATLNGLSFDDLVDGRPRLDLLPLELLEPPRLSSTFAGGPATVHTDMRPFSGRPPLTEFRFRTGQHKFQSISAVHAQERRRSLFGREGALNVLFRYGGRGSQGGYPNSAYRLRQTYGRILYRQARWMLELGNLHTRREHGVHGGVPARGAFDTVYERFGASVRLPSASHRIQRNDLTLRLGLRWHRRLAPLNVSGAFVSQLTRYTNRPDTLDALVHRYTLQTRQRLPAVLGQRLTLLVDAQHDALRRSRVWPDSLDSGTSRLYVGLRDSTTVLGQPVTLAAGFARAGEETFPSAEARIEPGLGPLGLFAGLSLTGHSPSRLDRQGFGSFLTGASEPRVGRVWRAQGGLRIRGGPFDLSVSGFASHTGHPIDYLATQTIDSVVVFQDHMHRRWAGVTADVGWRRAAARGFFGSVQVTSIRLLESDTPERVRLSESLPDLYGDGRLGLRYVLFLGDLDMAFFVRARGWTGFRSRTFHPQTTLFTLPLADARTFGPTGLVDLHFEGEIRTVTLYMRLENVLSGFAYPGVTQVPVYPLQEMAFRFGVFWPFTN